MKEIIYLTHKDETIPIEVKRYKSSKSIKLYMSDGYIRVTTSPLTSRVLIKKFIKSLQDRIVNYYIESKSQSQDVDSGIDINRKMFYMGRIIHLDVKALTIKSPRRNYELLEDKLIIYSYNQSNTIYNKGLVRDFFNEQAQQILIPFAQVIAKDIFSDFKPDIVLKRMKRQWGNCRYKRGRVTLNSKLIHLPKYLQTYIIIHEFAHFIHPNHGKEFHALVDKWLGGKEKQFDLDIKKWSFILKEY
jgi:predicted metal-dependent hydrolase